MAEFIENTKMLVKTAALFFTFIGFVGGLTLFIIGCANFNEMTAYHKISGEHEQSINPSHSIISFGSAITIISAFGAFSVVKEKQWMLLSYTGVLFLVAVIQIGFGIDKISKHDELATRVENGLFYSLRRYNNISIYYDQEIRDIWNNVQKDLKCCGVRNYENWIGAGGKQFPESCCRDASKACSDVLRKTKIEAEKLVHSKGCSELLIEFLMAKKSFITVITTGVMELGVVFLTYYLDNKYRGKGPNIL